MTLLKDLLASLSQYNRSQLLQCEPLHLDQMASSLIHSVKPDFEKKRIRLISDFQPDLPVINGDAIKFRQVFFNLLNNAADAMPDGGTITVKLWVSEDSLHLSVADTGEGIPKTGFYCFYPLCNLQAYRKRSGTSHRKTASQQKPIMAPSLSRAPPARAPVFCSPSPSSRMKEKHREQKTREQSPI